MMSREGVWLILYAPPIVRHLCTAAFPVSIFALAWGPRLLHLRCYFKTR